MPVDQLYEIAGANPVSEQERISRDVNESRAYAVRVLPAGAQGTHGSGEQNEEDQDFELPRRLYILSHDESKRQERVRANSLPAQERREGQRRGDTGGD